MLSKRRFSITHEQGKTIMSSLLFSYVVYTVLRGCNFYLAIPDDEINKIQHLYYLLYNYNWSKQNET